MSKWLKWSVIAVLIILLLPVLTVIIVANVVDPNDYKPMIIDQVKQHTGRDLVIEGDLSWQLWPPIGLVVGKTQLNNPQEFGSNAMIKLDEIVVDVQVLPLISKSVVIDEIRVDGFYFHLVKNEKGVTNLDDLTAQKSEPEDTAEDTPQEDSSTDTQEVGQKPALESIQIGKGIFINNAVLINEDLVTGEKQQVNLVNLTIGEFAFDKWFDFTFDILTEINQPELKIATSWTSQLQ